MSAANTLACILDRRDEKLIGVLKGWRDNPAFDGGGLTTLTLIFDSGEGVTFASNGSYWPTPRADVEREVRHIQKRAADAIGENEAMLRLAGELTR